MNRRTLIGKKFGMRTVIGLAPTDSGGSYKVKLRCDCGCISTARISRLLKNESVMCRACVGRTWGPANGGKNHNHINITGQRFGGLIATRRDDSAGTPSRWFFHCDCGTEKSISRSNVVSGKQRSCGCLLRKWQKSETNRIRAKQLTDKHRYTITPHGHLRRKAVAEGYHIFESMPCPHCNGTTYYTNGHGQCTQCHDERKKKYWPKYYASNWDKIRIHARKHSKALTDLVGVVRKISPELLAELGISGAKHNGKNYASGRRKLMHIIGEMRPELLTELGLTNGRTK